MSLPTNDKSLIEKYMYKVMLARLDVPSKFGGKVRMLWVFSSPLHRVDNPTSGKKRSKLVLPTPQISDVELEEVRTCLLGLMFLWIPCTWTQAATVATGHYFGELIYNCLVEVSNKLIVGLTCLVLCEWCGVLFRYGIGFWVKIRVHSGKNLIHSTVSFSYM